MLAKQDPIFAEAAKTIYRVTADQRVQHHCDAIERGERTHRTLVNQLNKQTNTINQQTDTINQHADMINSLTSEIAELKAQIAALSK